MSYQSLNEVEIIPSSELKRRISVTIEADLVEWLDKLVKNKIEYSSRSHLFEVALTKLKEKEEQN